jgi:hypothetical protein
MEHEAHHGHHHGHGTGIKWLDLTLALTAVVVSLVSLWLGIHSAQSMDKLVAANSYPYLEPSRSTNTFEPKPGTDRMRGTILYGFENNGVGPARIEWVEMSFNGKPVRNYDELLAACCSGMQLDTQGLNVRGSVSGSLVPANKSYKMTSWPEPMRENATWSALHSQMDQIKVSVCYCSVFDECFVRRPDESRPKSVKACSANPQMFEPRFSSE